MKQKLHLLILALMVSTFTVNAQSTEEGPSSSSSILQTENALFDLLYTIDVGALGSIGANGQAGIIFFNDQYWISAWQSDLIHILDNTGAFIETITIPGITGARSLTTDGTNIYIGTAATQIYVVDPTTRLVIDTINVTSSATARMVSYDPTLAAGAGGFWIGNFGNDIASVAMNGTELSVIPAATHGTVAYGGAIDNVSPGGPFLWIHHQAGTTGDVNRDQIVQLDPTTGVQTGVVYDFFIDGTGAGASEVLAGGLFISAEVDPAAVALVGLCQCTPSNLIFSVELTPQVLGSADNELSNFTLYPNPASGGTITIETSVVGEKHIAIFDVLGKRVLDTTITNSDLNISNLQKGIYLVQVTQNNSTATKKLIIN